MLTVNRGLVSAQWTDYETQIFVAACEIVIADGHRNGKCFTKYEWHTLVHIFNTNSGHNWSKQQLKNRRDALRLKHKRFEELINSSGVVYDTSTGLISASAEWWDRKMKSILITSFTLRLQEYKEYKDKDCREFHTSQACRTGFAMFEDSAQEDHRDEIPVDVESSDEGGIAALRSAAMDEFDQHSGDKRKAVGKRSKEKRKKFSSRDVLYSMDHATSASENIAAKIDHFIGAAMSDPKTCMSELLATGRLQKQTDLYFYTCKFLSQRANREVLNMQDNANDKFAWVEWSYEKYRKTQPR
ncbi:uncharacterized protein LOC111404461 [Olea europaea var. sylvestris]|uniref:uncharacterized protein LOC111404461 n=1 Tax=Olea europaea var. sylvestris TaxID=158386 RepID=UPI000C1D528B|nr:uncharacterized protein LOC111404461 [Olea europaea var. sylvestris]